MFGNFASSFITNCHVRACAVQRRPPPQLSSFVFPIIIFAAAAAENDCPVPGSVGGRRGGGGGGSTFLARARPSVRPLPLSLSSHPWGLPSPLIIISRWKHLAATAATTERKEAAAAIPVVFPSPSLDDGGDDESLIFPHAQRQDKARRRRRRRLGPRRPRLSGCCPIRTLSFVALPLLPPRADVGLAVRLTGTAAVDDVALIFHFAPNDSRTSLKQGPDQEEDEFTFFYMANFRPSPVRVRLRLSLPAATSRRRGTCGRREGNRNVSPLASPPPFTSTFFLR